MGFFDDLKKAITKTAAKEGAKAAVDDAARRVEEAADGLLTQAEAELKDAQARHDKRHGDFALPSTAASDPDWAQTLRETERSARRTRAEVATSASTLPESAPAGAVEDPVLDVVQR